MRYLIISDIHANLEALQSVVALAPPATFDRLLVLGDIVGYGADPNAVVDRVRELAPHVIIRGNHDKVAAGLEDAEGFNAAARQSALWTHDQLTEANRAYLAALPAGPRMSDDFIEVCHGSPYDEDAYVFEHGHALQALEAASRPLCFFGHTHVQIGYWVSTDAFDVIVPDSDDDCLVTLESNRRYLFNPGSIGQPRDGDPRAAFAEYDSERRVVTLRRAAYDVATAQGKISRAGLPEGLARRLGVGK
jgi:diadenosine tetraphosphatase ApaH/serine/threonine PP2A family protein phosphatase